MGKMNLQLTQPVTDPTLTPFINGVELISAGSSTVLISD
jgi:hypothetical protein